MSFTSPEFYLALSLVLGAYVSFPRQRRNILLVASLIFFLELSGLPHFLLFLSIVVMNFALARKPLWVNLALNFGVLIFFKLKIAAFYFQEAGAFNHTGVAGILLPVGLSFYTFQLAAYQIDSHRDRTSESFAEFLLFISFFPQLVAGPIERKHELLPQLRNLPDRVWHFDPDAILLIVWGLFKKLVVAERASVLSRVLFRQEQTLSGLEALLSGIIFGIQIYGDFSGYTTIARGLGKLFGIELRENFLSPYTAPSLREFWRRWHVTLSAWFRDYVYNPLGRTTKALFLVFILSGLWHGSTPLFLVWGIYHGVFLFLERSLKRKLPGPFGIVMTFFIVSLGWIFFRSDSFTQAGEIFRSLFTFSGNWPGLPNIGLVFDRVGWAIFIAGTFGVFALDHVRFSRAPVLSENLRVGIFFLLLLCVLFLGSPQPKPFLYFHF